ncbi:hypothetical protein [Pseudomonas sp. RGM2987]|uniref:hypothetical protein n=1 Tax=Pseudomonas sp. RGM2987 TaxID=2930090 RepID=UPI001FD672D6|nr:hypothetical protein [Pseudomonas sp. RGM2987]MCJ8207509.1 hypothetical protein [Pseudomonas sp. RGM2987]
MADAVSDIRFDPAPHIGKAYKLTDPQSTDMEHHARIFSDALGRPITYRDVSVATCADNLRDASVPPHVVDHLSIMAQLHQQGGTTVKQTNCPL